MYSVVSHDQTSFRTEGRGLGHGHRAVCRPTLWSAYQSQRSIQSQYLKYVINGNIQNFSLSGESTLKHEKLTEQELSSVMSWNTNQNRNRKCKQPASLTLVIAIADDMTRSHDQLNSWATSRSMAMSQTPSLSVEWGLAT